MKYLRFIYAAITAMFAWLTLAGFDAAIVPTIVAFFATLDTIVNGEYK